MLLVSAIQQSEPTTHICTSTLFQIPFPCRSPQRIRQKSLHYTVGSLINHFIKSSIYMSISISQYVPPPLPTLVSVVVFYTYDSPSSLLVSLSPPFFQIPHINNIAPVFVFLFLSYFTLDDNLWVHLCHYKWHYFIPFCG